MLERYLLQRYYSSDLMHLITSLCWLLTIGHMNNAQTIDLVAPCPSVPDSCNNTRQVRMIHPEERIDRYFPLNEMEEYAISM